MKDFDWDGWCHVAKSKSEFEGWEVLMVEQWKTGVKRVHCRHVHPEGSGMFRMVYVSDAEAPEVTNATNEKRKEDI